MSVEIFTVKRWIPINKTTCRNTILAGNTLLSKEIPLWFLENSIDCLIFPEEKLILLLELLF